MYEDTPHKKVAFLFSAGFWDELGLLGAFGSSWGDASKMDSTMATWISDMKSGQNVPDLKNLQDGFQTINQSVSEFSSTTNTQLQFVENQFKQGMGEENSAIQAYQKMNSNTIRHFTSS